ncbi:hypothetical protein [Streptomyces sp. SHP 1-2]|uniref:hypothetical protein n=1 Tax=Streptomyces sp. SHP 1-2 TaxID=2769489 RepID=UPI002238A0CB|nr:hypothetical protein [Streptomyces sp. SHP 1-2]MCW5249182.1 hypothetical protein [Streptomyces sp. SHP 1-2]
MDSTIILVVLACFGVLAIFVWSLQSFLKQLQGFLDDLPEFFASYHRARRAMRDRGDRGEQGDRGERDPERPTEAEPPRADADVVPGPPAPRPGAPEFEPAAPAPREAADPAQPVVGDAAPREAPRRGTPA